MNELTEILNVMVGLHREMLDVSLQKTDILKEGDVDNIQRVLVLERKLLRKIEKAEQSRMEIVQNVYGGKGTEHTPPTITMILEQIADQQEREQLERVTIELTEVITELKAQEKLNLDLLNQSMQFVQMSLDLLQPSLKNMNYFDKSDQTIETPNRSIFDSKA